VTRNIKYPGACACSCCGACLLFHIHAKEILVVAGSELIPLGCKNPLELIKFMIVTDT
jgi:hypothetical protein